MALHLYETGNGALSYTTDIDRAWQLEEVRIHLSANGGAGTFTVTIDSAQGEAYDLELATNDMSADDDYQYQPTRPMFMAPGDQVKVTYPNAQTKTYGLEIIYR